MPKLGKLGKSKTLTRSFKVFATIIGYRMDPHPGARSCASRGSPSCEAVPSEPSMNVYIHSTTGTRFELSLPQEETVEGLKKRLSQRLKIPKERLALLHKETRLSSGRLLDLGVTDRSRLTLVPTVEAGLMSQASRPEQSVMQALESLTETQVSDFLCGRSPLTLALRVGDHMMFVQLQLASQQAVGGAGLQSRGGRGGAEAPGLPSGSAAPSSGHPRVPLPQHPAPSPAASPPPPPAPVYSSTSRHSSPPPPSPCLPQQSVFLPPRQAPPSPQRPPPPASSPQPSCSTKPSGNSSSSRSRKPGAVIESFVNHGPGVFSGTFSGTLHPNCQDSSGRPRRDISTILQILNDLLSATRHYQGAPPSLSQLRQQATPSPPPCPPAPATPAAPSARTPPLHPLVQSQIHMCRPHGDRVRQTENRATRCKVERLQLLMQQKRVRRKSRRDQRAPYHWLPSRKAGRSHSNSSLSSEGSLDLDYDEALWKQSDMKTESLMA
ncbi:midnolin [Osmerus eperlanus]|uniref:midnolin n=1 Tax=Osmerus eperlanus TaxID=29151 RepID=UPI002E0F9840